MTRVILVGILLCLIAWGFWRLVDAVIEGLGGRTSRRGRRPPVKLVRDPVCGTFVAPRDSLSLRAGNTTHFFCSERCRDAYRKTA